MLRDRDHRRLLTYEIMRLSEAGHSQRDISRALGVARKTVKSILAEIETRRAAGDSAVERVFGRRRVPKGSKLDDFDKRIRNWLDEYPKLTAVRCLEMLRDEGFDGNYTIVREHMRRLRKQVSPKPAAVVVETAVGQRAEFDWSPYTLASGLKVQLWNATLCWSRATYLAGATNTRQTTILHMLRSSFESWGGVPRECLTDSMPGVVDRWECDHPLLNPRFVDFAAYYGFKVIIAPRACPKFKARAERNFRYHEENLLGGRTISSFSQYQQLLDWWQRNRAMRRRHPKMGREICSVFEQEQPYLRPLPPRPYDTREVVVRVVSSTGHVHYETNEYPLPDGHIGDRVYVCVGEDRIEICDRHAQRLAEHARLPDGQGIQLPQLGSTVHRGRYDVDSLIERISEWGEEAADFARAVRKARRYAGPQLARLLNLQLDWSLDDIVAAMQHAARYRCYDSVGVTRILEARFTPRRFEAAIAESTRRHIQHVMKGHPVRQRPISSYESFTKGDQQSCRNVDDNDDHQEDANRTRC